MNTAVTSLIHHPLSTNDANIAALIQQQTAAFKGQLLGPENRAEYDAMLEQTPASRDVIYEYGIVGGVRGVWCRPNNSRDDVFMLYLHGGGYIVGSAQAYRNFVGHIATQAKITVFIPEYSLAPEAIFPAAIEDALNSYLGLSQYGAKQIIITGDSAGGGLALVLLALAQAEALENKIPAPVAAVAISPWTDLALTGASLSSKSEVEFYLTYSGLEHFRSLYKGTGSVDFKDPLFSPLYGVLDGLPPLQIHVGSSEILLDDTLRYVERATQSGVAACAHIWEGMPHVFVSGVGVFEAADHAIALIAKFVDDCLN